MKRLCHNYNPYEGIRSEAGSGTEYGEYRNTGQAKFIIHYYRNTGQAKFIRNTGQAKFIIGMEPDSNIILTCCYGSTSRVHAPRGEYGTGQIHYWYGARF